MDHNLFIHFTVSGHSEQFLSVTVSNNDALNIYLGDDFMHFCWKNWHPVVELLGHRVYSIQFGGQRVLQSDLTGLYSCHQELRISSVTLPTLGIVSLFKFTYSGGCPVLSLCFYFAFHWLLLRQSIIHVFLGYSDICFF